MLESIPEVSPIFPIEAGGGELFGGADSLNAKESPATTAPREGRETYAGKNQTECIYLLEYGYHLFGERAID